MLRAIRQTDPKVPIDLILHNPGGLMLAAEQIAYALCEHIGPVNVIIPHYAMSGGTFIALAADNILMDKNGVLGPVDPQIKNFPTASILSAVDQKDKNELDDETLIHADISKKAIKQIKDSIVTIIVERMEDDIRSNLAEDLSSGNWTHDYPIRVDEARKLGLSVSTDIPVEVYELMELYPQTNQIRPSVQYVPFSREEDNESSSNIKKF